MARDIVPASQLGRFMTENKITSMQLAVRAGVSTVTIYKLRRGYSEPRRATIASLVRAASALARRPVRADELFDLGNHEQTP